MGETELMDFNLTGDVTPELKEKLMNLFSVLSDPKDQYTLLENSYLIIRHRNAVRMAKKAQEKGGIKPQELHNLKSKEKALDKLRLLAEMEISDILRPLGLANPFI